MKKNSNNTRNKKINVDKISNHIKAIDRNHTFYFPADKEMPNKDNVKLINESQPYPIFRVNNSQQQQHTIAFHNKEMINFYSGAKGLHGTYDVKNPYTQVYNGIVVNQNNNNSKNNVNNNNNNNNPIGNASIKGKGPKVFNVSLNGIEELVKVKGEIELTPYLKNIDTAVSLTISVSWTYEAVGDDDPMNTSLLNSLKYEYLNKNRENFSKKTEEEKRIIAKSLDTDKTFNQFYSSNCKPFINYLNNMLYGYEDVNKFKLKWCNDIDIDTTNENNSNKRNVIYDKIYFKKRIWISGNDTKPKTIKYSFYPIAPLSKHIYCVRVSSWRIQINVQDINNSNLGQIPFSVKSRMRAIVLDRYYSYKLKVKNFNRTFNKFKAFYHNLVNDYNNNVTMRTFEGMLKDYLSNANHSFEYGEKMLSNSHKYIPRKIYASKLYLITSPRILYMKKNTSGVVRQKIFSRELFNKDNIINHYLIGKKKSLDDNNPIMKISKIYINVAYFDNTDNDGMNNSQVRMSVYLNTMCNKFDSNDNINKSDYLRFELASIILSRDDIVQNHKKNVIVIKNMNNSDFYFKYEWDYIDVSVFRVDNIGEKRNVNIVNNNNNDYDSKVLILDSYIKYLPMINLSGKLVEDSNYYFYNKRVH